MLVRFLVMADLHVDIMHDAAARIQIVCEAAKKNGVDFILHLGDMMYPDVSFLQKHAPESLEKRKNAIFLCDRDDEKAVIFQLLQQTGIPVYGVLGNHDMDACSKETMCAYWGMPAPHYSFVAGGVRFIVLDSNFVKVGEDYIDYDHSNYRQYPRSETTYLSPDQLQWLELLLSKSKEKCVLLSHASLANEHMNVYNMQDVWKLIEEANTPERKVILGLNGHSHIDGLTVRKGVPFVTVNSISNFYMGVNYRTVRYSDTICTIYPHLSNCAPFYDPLYSIVTIDDNGIEMTGMHSSFVGLSPEQLNYPKESAYFEPTPCIRERKLPITQMSDEGPIAE